MCSANSELTGCLILVLLTHFGVHGQNATNVTTTAAPPKNASNPNDIDFETLSLFGVSHEFAEQFRINLIKAIEAAKDEVDPLRQGEFGGVSGGFYQGAGGGGGQGGQGGGQSEEEEEEEESGPTTPGPGAFGVLSGLFGIFSGLGSLNPTRIIQSTVNFFPPGQRMQAQMIVDSLIGYTPPENRTHRPRPRTRRPSTTPMTITEMMMKEVTEGSMNGTKVVTKGGDNSTDGEGSPVDAMAEAEVIVAPPEPPTTTTEGFINVHELLERSTTPEPPQNEDDENDFERKQYTTTRPKSNASVPVYKVKEKVQVVEIRGVSEDDATKLNATTSAPTMLSTEEPTSGSPSVSPVEISSATTETLAGSPVPMEVSEASSSAGSLTFTEVASESSVPNSTELSASKASVTTETLSTIPPQVSSEAPFSAEISSASPSLTSTEVTLSTEASKQNAPSLNSTLPSTSSAASI